MKTRFVYKGVESFVALTISKEITYEMKASLNNKIRFAFPIVKYNNKVPIFPVNVENKSTVASTL